MPIPLDGPRGFLSADGDTGSTRATMAGLLATGPNRASSGYLGTALKARLVPFPRLEDLRKDLGCANHLGVAVVERRKGDADQVRGAEVADDAARDQGLHDRIALGMREHDVAAALRR